MNTPISRHQELQAQITEAIEKIAGLETKLRALDELLASISEQRQKYQLLGELCVSLQKLNDLGAADLFWGEPEDSSSHSSSHESKLTRMQAAVAEFQQKVTALQQSRNTLLADIQNKTAGLHPLQTQLAKLRDTKSRPRNQSVVARAARPMPLRPVALPWSRQGQDERRFHLILAGFFLLTLALGVLVATWELPPPDPDQEIIVPERLARLIKKREQPPEPKPLEKKEEQPLEKDEKKIGKGEPIPPTKKTETEQARATAETKGVLALKDSLAELMKESTTAGLGADTRISIRGNQKAGGSARRSIIVAQRGSGGINSAALSRQSVGSASESVVPAVKIARVESNISSATAREIDRPLNKETGPSRSDEEIQIVFDRYKAALYRIYNRELRSDPLLHGKMVLRITIETDGHVSACSVKSTDLVSPTLLAEIVGRVLEFNFGPKVGVSAVTILYPIEFLPAV